MGNSVCKKEKIAYYNDGKKMISINTVNEERDYECTIWRKHLGVGTALR